MAESKAEAADRLARAVAEVRALRAADLAHPARREATLALKRWQSGRLARTYDDLLASARHGDAARFFFEDLYGPKDFSKRDADVARILPKLRALLPAAALSTIADALELDCLSEELDQALATSAATAIIDEDGYAAAYRAFSLGDATFADDLGRISCPALFLTGADDPNSTADMARGMAASTPLGQFVVIDHHRHMVNLTAPDLVNAALTTWLATPLAHLEKRA